MAGVVIGTGELALSIDSRPGGAPQAAAQLVDSAVARPAVPTPHVGGRTTVSTTIPAWTKRWNAPVHDLADFLSRAPGVDLGASSVMMTVDDGPTPPWTSRYLDLFARNDVKATFNMIGAQVAANSALVRAMVSEGHSLSNHTWTHDLNLPERSPAEIRGEIARTNDAIEKAAGVRPKIFRAPGGNWGPRIFDELANEQMLPLGWDVDPRDWSCPGVARISSTMLQTRPGDIVLCHDGGGDRAQTYAALQAVLPVLRERGLNFITLPLNG